MRGTTVYAVIVLLCAVPGVALGATTEVGPLNGGTPLSGGTLIDFGTIANGQVVSNQISGLTFTNWWGSSAYHLDFFNDPDGIQIANFTPTDVAGRGNATIVFNTAVTSIGFELLTNNSAMTFDVISGSSTNTFSLTGARCDSGPPCTPLFLFTNPAGITELVFHGDPAPNGAFVIDNLVLNGQVGGTTPEPGSLLLLGSGLIGLSGAVRRKFRR